MFTSFEHIVGTHGPARHARTALHDVAATRLLEVSAAGPAGAPSLMQQAGLALAQLTLAIAPHARHVWVACGPGNNGGDGLQAASYLQRWGKQVTVSQAAPHVRQGDAAKALQCAQDAGVHFSGAAPLEFDVCMDALFGIGALRPLEGLHALWVQTINAAGKPVIAADVPSGLDADTGAAHDLHVRASHTLSLLTLKPGLFTAQGRDACGEIWFHNLGVEAASSACARLIGPPAQKNREHSSHKGTYGDVCVVGGAPGMAGAALLAASAALHGGSGRVYVHMLNPHAQQWDALRPELMFRNVHTLDLANTVVVAGCGGADAIADVLPLMRQKTGKLVLDADALNHIATSALLQKELLHRAPMHTVLTPHPLEAARLLETSTQVVQANRMQAAAALSTRYQCTVVLKGSGTIVSAPAELAHINPTGNAKLATAGTGDVLAGLIGAEIAKGASPWFAACHAVYRHGLAANNHSRATLTASSLMERL